MKVFNSYYEKSSESRMIMGWDSDDGSGMYITPQKYNMIEKTSFGAVTSYNYQFDGQIFTRAKKHGGNGKSSWAICGNGLTKKDIAMNSKEFASFKELFNKVLVADVSAPMMITDNDLVIMKGLMK